MLNGKKSYLISFTALFSKKGYELTFGLDDILNVNNQYHLTAPVNSTYHALKMETMRYADKIPHSATGLFGKLSKSYVVTEQEGIEIETVVASIVSYLSDVYNHFSNVASKRVVEGVNHRLEKGTYATPDLIAQRDDFVLGSYNVDAFVENGNKVTLSLKRVDGGVEELTSPNNISRSLNVNIQSLESADEFRDVDNTTEIMAELIRDVVDMGLWFASESSLVIPEPEGDVEALQAFGLVDKGIENVSASEPSLVIKGIEIEEVSVSRYPDKVAYIIEFSEGDKSYELFIEGSVVSQKKEIVPLAVVSGAETGKRLEVIFDSFDVSRLMRFGFADKEADNLASGFAETVSSINLHTIIFADVVSSFNDSADVSSFEQAESVLSVSEEGTDLLIQSSIVLTVGSSRSIDTVIDSENVKRIGAYGVDALTVGNASFEFESITQDFIGAVVGAAAEIEEYSYGLSFVDVNEHSEDFDLAHVVKDTFLSSKDSVFSDIAKGEFTADVDEAVYSEMYGDSLRGAAAFSIEQAGIEDTGFDAIFALAESGSNSTVMLDAQVVGGSSGLSYKESDSGIDILYDAFSQHSNDIVVHELSDSFNYKSDNENEIVWLSTAFLYITEWGMVEGISESEHYKEADGVRAEAEEAKTVSETLQIHNHETSLAEITIDSFTSDVADLTDSTLIIGSGLSIIHHLSSVSYPLEIRDAWVVDAEESNVRFNMDASTVSWFEIASSYKEFDKHEHTFSLADNALNEKETDILHMTDVDAISNSYEAVVEDTEAGRSQFTGEGVIEEGTITLEYLREVIANSPEITETVRLMTIMYGSKANELIEAGINNILTDAVIHGISTANLEQITQSVIEQLKEAVTGKEVVGVVDETSFASESNGAIGVIESGHLADFGAGSVDSVAESIHEAEHRAAFGGGVIEVGSTSELREFGRHVDIHEFSKAVLEANQKLAELHEHEKAVIKDFNGGSTVDEINTAEARDNKGLGIIEQIDVAGKDTGVEADIPREIESAISDSIAEGSVAISEVADRSEISNIVEVTGTEKASVGYSYEVVLHAGEMATSDKSALGVSHEIESADVSVVGKDAVVDEVGGAVYSESSTDAKVFEIEGAGFSVRGNEAEIVEIEGSEFSGRGFDAVESKLEGGEFSEQADAISHDTEGATSIQIFESVVHGQEKATSVDSKVGVIHEGGSAYIGDRKMEVADKQSQAGTFDREAVVVEQTKAISDLTEDVFVQESAGATSVFDTVQVATDDIDSAVRKRKQIITEVDNGVGGKNIRPSIEVEVDNGREATRKRKHIESVVHEPEVAKRHKIIETTIEKSEGGSMKTMPAKKKSRIWLILGKIASWSIWNWKKTR